MRRLTTYEKLQALSDAYAQAAPPARALRKEHTALWVLAWSATLPRSNAWPDVRRYHITYSTPQELLRALSVYRHARVDGTELASAVAHHVHAARDVALPRDVWEPLLRTAERLYVACADIEPMTPLPPPPPPALLCLAEPQLLLALEAPDVRKTALALYYRREMRCHEHVRPGHEASSVQRNRPAHVVHKARHTLLHAPLSTLRSSPHYDNFVLAQTHCTLFGQHGLDFGRRVLCFEAELSVPVMHALAFPMVVERRRSWCLMWRGRCSEAMSLPRILSLWKATVLHHELNPIDSRHDVMGL